MVSKSLLVICGRAVSLKGYKLIFISFNYWKKIFKNFWK